MSAPGSRLARQMRPHLGAALWSEFVAHANRHYKAGWLRAFAPASGVLRCVGALDGAPCAHAALVDLRAGDGTGVETGEREVGTVLERRGCTCQDHKRTHGAEIIYPVDMFSACFYALASLSMCYVAYKKRILYTLKYTRACPCGFS